jgi:membrane-bound lytic murein transglycosylase B
MRLLCPLSDYSSIISIVALIEVCTIYPLPSVAAEAPPAASAQEAAARAFEPKSPATWRLVHKLGPGTLARSKLIADLCAPATSPGEAALSPAEAEALLADPRAQLIYGEKTVAIVAPSWVTRQRKDHVDLLKLFLKPERVRAGLDFVRSHASALERAAARHAVDREVLVSILMWESRLGATTGDYAAFNSFASQAFFIEEANEVALSGANGATERRLYDAKRQAERVEAIRSRARSNLLALARTCKARAIDPLSIKGSWAGALGFPQFMPASLRWAEDGDGDGKIDLFTFDDSIASIAHYLEAHGFAKNREEAVWGYNHEEAYVKGVLGYADALKAALAKIAPEPSGQGAAGGPAGGASAQPAPAP